MLKIIAISGWKQSGKDTIADHLVEKMNYVKFSFASTLKDMVAEQYNIPRDWCDNPDFKEKPLLQYPVETKDKFTEMLHEFMIKEFRDIDGNIPHEYFKDPGGFFFVKNRNGMSVGWDSREVFWTPRALCILEGSVKRSVNSSFWVQTVIDRIKRVASANVTGELRGNFVIADLRYKSEVEQLRDVFGSSAEIVRINRFDSSPSTDPSERDLDDYETFDVTLNLKNKSVQNVKDTIDKLYIGV